MIVEKIVVGYLEENCYIVTKNNKTIIIDPGDEASKIINVAKNKNVVGILVTHHHPDHIGALKEIEEYYNLKETKEVESFDFKVINTSGHTKDSVSYYFPKEKVLFVGDFLFLNSIGRTDLPTGSDIEMQASLELISKYPDDVIVYPGHGEATTLGHEKNNFRYYY